MSEMLDIVGIFFFAMTGALTGVRKRLDVVGMLLLAEITALGGGVARDLILETRPAAFQSVGYVLAPVAATVVVTFWHPHVTRVLPAIMVLDAAGLGFFAAAGTEKALAFGMSPLHAALLGLTTAVGGGILRDILAGEIPTLLYDRQLYAVPAMVGSALRVLLFELHVRSWVATLAAVLVTFALRISAMRFGWRAPLARGVASD